MFLSVAMTTFNGERFLTEQLDSLLAQKRLPDELVVGDDLSEDSTIHILNAFRSKAPFDVKIHQNRARLGFAENFLNTARRCSGQWVAFCDQDDVWLPDRLIEVEATALERPGLSLILHRAELCDEHLNVLRGTFPPHPGKGYFGANRRPGFWVWPGFLMAVNSDLIRQLDDSVRPISYYRPDGQQPHDKWFSMIGNALGGVYIIDRKSVLYRRHGGTVTGKYDRKTFVERTLEAGRVGAANYNHLAAAARSCVSALERTAQQVVNKDKAEKFLISASHFEGLRRTYELREKLYSHSSFLERSGAFYSLLMSHGYIGNPFRSLGLRALAKDFLRLLVGSRIWNSKPR
ncbi:glycosyltransferase [Henriciella barbarensis]|uniref:glycosyltransferase n=1 Tax=Henriciella barbarensis TaxID=86342 RepID=UPI001F3B7E1D|nr:glycosyltransferase [Henriciella barbarensis]